MVGIRELDCNTRRVQPHFPQEFNGAGFDEVSIMRRELLSVCQNGVNSVTGAAEIRSFFSSRGLSEFGDHVRHTFLTRPRKRGLFYLPEEPVPPPSASPNSVSLGRFCISSESSIRARPGFVAVLNPSGCVAFFDFDDGSAMRSVFASDVNIRLINITPRISSQTIIPFMLSITHPVL